MSKTYVAQRGDCLASIAAQFGLPDWHTLYDAPENASLKQLRPNPNLIQRGDEVVIPDVPDASSSVPNGAEHSFEVPLPDTTLVLKLAEDITGKPMKADYELALRGVADPIKGSLAGGVLNTPIPASVGRGTLVLRSPTTGKLLDTIDLYIGQLEPVETIAGVQTRLRRLGFDCGPGNGELTPATDGTLRLFQRLYKLPVDGTANQATQDKLKELVGA
jgi:hypothetical protein